MDVDWKKFIVSSIIVYTVAVIGIIFISGDTGKAFYEVLNKNTRLPLNLFFVFWIVLFFFISISLYLSWKESNETRKIFVVFGTNLFLNLLWGLLYFGLGNPGFAFIEIIILEVSTAMMIITLYPINKKSAYLLFPYFLWIALATVLNYLTI